MCYHSQVHQGAARRLQLEHLLKGGGRLHPHAPAHRRLSQREEHKTTIVEVGTCYGGNSLHMAQRLKHSRLYAVDPFLAGYDAGDVQSVNFANLCKERNIQREELWMLWADAISFDFASNGRTNWGLVLVSLQLHRLPHLEIDILHQHQ